MAGSRVEKLSTIFARYTGLIKSGGVRSENRPLWYDVYESFPPTVPPLAIREEPKVTINNIFYPEDILRSRFNRAYGDFASVVNYIPSPTSPSTPSSTEPSSAQSNICELFISKYLQLAKSSSPDGSIDLHQDSLFRATEDALKSEFGVKLVRRTSAATGGGTRKDTK